jgi:LPS sulfotransferase NodH
MTEGDAAALRAELLGDGAEGSLARFLAGRGAQSHIVAGRDLIAALPPDPAQAFTWSESPDGVPPSAKAIYVDSDTGEFALWRTVAERFPDRRVWGLRHHVMPMLAGDGQPRKDVPPDFRIEALRRYVIVCPARSGSTFLEQMLGQAGIGRAREHLRDGLLAAFRTPGVDTIELWRQLAWRAARGGVFATKLVGQFVIPAAGARPLGELLAELAPEGVPVIALHRPVIDTTVSRYIAGGARLYHVRGAMTPEERGRFESRPYNDRELRRVLEANLDEVRTLDAGVAQLPADRVLHVAYADLDAEPIRTLERVAAFIGVAPDLRGLKPERLPLKISAQVDSSARIRARFLAQLRDEGVDVDALAR